MTPPDAERRPERTDASEGTAALLQPSPLWQGRSEITNAALARLRQTPPPDGLAALGRVFRFGRHDGNSDAALGELVLLLLELGALSAAD